MPKKPKKLPKQHGGPRAGSGRPLKPDRGNYTQVTCVLRNDTIQRLRTGAASRFFGEFLQTHLDRFPLPSHEQYLLLRNHQPKTVKKPARPASRRPSPVSAAQQIREQFRRKFRPVLL